LSNPSAPRILLFHANPAIGGPLRAQLAEEGWQVGGARSFLEAAPSLVAGRLDLLLIFLPDEAWARNATLTEVRRVNPSLPIVALAPSVTDELVQGLVRLRVTTVLRADVAWEDLLTALREALGAAGPAPGDAA